MVCRFHYTPSLNVKTLTYYFFTISIRAYGFKKHSRLSQAIWVAERRPGQGSFGTWCNFFDTIYVTVLLIQWVSLCSTSYSERRFQGWCEMFSNRLGLRLRWRCWCKHYGQRRSGIWGSWKVRWSWRCDGDCDKSRWLWNDDHDATLFISNAPI